MELDLVEALPAALDMGAPFTLVVAVPHLAVDLSAANYLIRDAAEVHAQGRLGRVEIPDSNPDLHDPRNGPPDLRPRVHLALQTPATVGTFQWQLMVPAQTIGACDITEARLDLAFATTEHRTSLAAWDVPSPVQAGETFKLKLGAKCSGGCDLRGLQIGAPGQLHARANLGPACWPEAEGLYWCEMEIVAPNKEGLHEMGLSFAAEGLPVPHRPAHTTIAFVVTPPASHRVEIELRDRTTGLPIEEAQVRFGPHRKAADARGYVSFDVAAGSHRLFIWKANCEFEESFHDVHRNLTLVIEGLQSPPPSPFARWEG